MSTTHENFTRQVDHRGPSDRNFGVVFTLALSVLGVWPLRHGKPVRPLYLALAGAILLVTLIRPSLLHAANRVWTRLGILLGKIVNPLVTGLLFYLVFTPVAAILRWTGKDLLGLSMDRDAKSYWVPKNQPHGASSMADQF